MVGDEQTGVILFTKEDKNKATRGSAISHLRHTIDIATGVLEHQVFSKCTTCVKQDSLANYWVGSTVFESIRNTGLQQFCYLEDDCEKYSFL